MRARLASLGIAVLATSLLLPIGVAGADPPAPAPLVLDTVPPEITVPPDMIVQSTSPTGAPVTYVATAYDLVDGTLPTICDPAPGSQFPLGTTTVTCTATDTSGNTGTATFSVTVVTPCTVHCDCDQGEFCYKGRCLRDPKQAVYCAAKPGCPPGHWAIDLDNTKTRCPETTDYVCGDACDCGPAHCCKYSPDVGHNVCVKDTDDPWLPGGTESGPSCESEDATYCCGSAECFAGVQARGEDAASFRCLNRASGEVQTFCGGAACFGTACNCEPGESCLDTTGHADFGTTCLLLGGGSCLSNALAEAIFGVGPAELRSCCATACGSGSSTLECDTGAQSGCGPTAYERIVTTCGTNVFPGTCGDGFCTPAEVGQCADCDPPPDNACDLDDPWAAPGDCSCPDSPYYPMAYEVCGDGVCSASGALGPESPHTCPADCGPDLLTLYVNGRDANIAPGAEVPAGDLVEWRFVARNQGGPLSSVALAFDVPGVVPGGRSGDTNADEVLDPGETWTWQATSTALEGPQVAHATLTATADGTATSDDDVAHYSGVPAAGLAVDETQLRFSRYLGGSTGRLAHYYAPDVARDALRIDGSLWVVGQTHARDFPATEGPRDLAGAWDAFLAEVDDEGTLGRVRLLGEGTARAIAGDEDGLWIAGSFGLLRLDAALDEVWTVPFDDEGLYDVAVDADGRAWVAGGEAAGVARVSAGGEIEMSQHDLAGSVRAVAPASDGGAYVAGSMGLLLLDADGNVTWSVALGGTGSAIAIHDGHLYVVGETSEPGHATSAAFDAALDGETDAFLAVVEPGGTGGTITSWTYLGGSGTDAAADVVVDEFGFAHVAGTTASADFPVTDNAFDRRFAGYGDAFLAKLRPAGPESGAASLAYATFIGGTDPGTTIYGGVSVDLPYLTPDRAFGIELEPGGRTWMVGETGSVDLPVVGSSNLPGFTDAMVVGLTVPNQLPVAVAGSDRQLLAGETITLDGTGSHDPDGVITGWAWTLPGGPIVTGPTAQVRLAVPGTYGALLRVTDDRGAETTDTVVLTVISASAAIQALITEVRAIVLPPNVANGLVAKLQDGAAALDRGNARVAVNKLNDFIAQVEGLRGKRLTDAQADLLVAAARRILAVLR